MRTTGIVIAPPDGWTLDSVNTWTFASATTFTIAGVDLTAVFTKGTRIRLTNSTLKYFVVLGSSFSTNTTVTVTGGSDYSLAAGAITNPAYSYQASPQGYPGSFNWVPVYTGFSANPTINFAKFWVVGNQVTANYFMNALGVSNATTFTITLPVAGLAAENAIVLGLTVDSGAPSNNNNGGGNLAGAVLSVFQNAGGTPFTATGNKGLYHFTISYIF